ncbi:MAG: hypothetical protein N4A59_00640 [Marinifilum sp.]|jgi:hypothetical protein|nr:hypothetical protein [Marinifilum sp.]
MAVFKYVELDNLLLDSSNSRLSYNSIGEDEGALINRYLLEDSTIELMMSIGKNGFFEGEQLFVVPYIGDKFKVIDGNRRLSSVKLLHNPAIAKQYKSKVDLVVAEAEHKPDKLPCLIFDDENQILKYLGYRHITGIKSWKLLEKARYMTKLHNDYFSGKTLKDASRDIAKMIGSRRDYVLRILSGYKLYEVIEKNNFYGIKTVDDSSFHFNYIADSLSRSGIQKFLGVDLNKDNPTENLQFPQLEEWTNWFFNKNLPNKIIGDSEHLNWLNKVIENEKALNAFRSGVTITKALEYTNEIGDQFKKLVKESIEKLEEADSLMYKIETFYEDLGEDLTSINRIIRKIKTTKDDLSNEFEL